ncbi:MAG TPA: GntR family transcriptional regulator [Anaerolineaceae bacterium]|nr:GntR family transcriptional regulator [Anaerolineaceae bacterium]
MGKDVFSSEDLPDIRILKNYQRIQDLVFTTLRDEILSNKIKPDEKLNTNQLAKRLGVSRTPIREALNRLISIGLVETIPHRGTYIRKLSIEEIIDLYYIRAALDGISARLAVRNLSQEDTTRLLQFCDDMETQYNLGDFNRFLELNYQFHQTIYKATQSPQLQELIIQYYNQSEHYRSLGLELPGRYRQICGEHRNLAKALADGDAEKAEFYAREHHFNTAKQIAKSIGSEILI